MLLLKIDENLHDDVAEILRGRGHDVETVYGEGLQGEDDTTIASRCQEEGGALVMLDSDFVNITVYAPQDSPGLRVRRVANQNRPQILCVFERGIDVIDQEPLSGHLWIIEEHPVRIRGTSE